MYGLYDRKGNFYIGNKPIVNVDNNIVVEDEEYEGTPGLWELIVSKEPKDFTKEDYENYTKLMIKTSTLYRDTQKAVKVINGIIYLVTFGKIGKSMKEVELLLFQVILTRC